MSGILYIVATPIGNLEDLSARAGRILRECAAIACEDTRQTRKLLNHLHIERPLIAFHEHNENEKSSSLVNRMLEGQSLALVSDAGTPLISDPGYRLVDAAIAAGITVVPIPGASAMMAALSASGLPTDSFYFGGFLHPKQGPRLKQLQVAGTAPSTLIFYEAPHRILECLADIHALYPEARVVLARELTKMHEEFLRGPALALQQTLAARDSVRGEFTVLIGPRKAAVQEATQTPALAVAALIAQGVERMDAIKQVAKERGLHKRDLYRQLEEE
ncbi:MAG: 16S rRNA (cytidine(1402)-2'-O)-methyltransferase [Candidatus Solibacter usitatus]|nr:16S rRNA (cytidine(1402)-2'-O)-methyltransferase [Candidatus Solibacter usitatus]